MKNKNRPIPKHKNFRWPILILILIIVIGVIVMVFLTQNNPPNGLISGDSTPQIKPSIGSTPDNPTPQSEPAQGLTPTKLTPQSESQSNSIPDALTPQMTYEVIQAYPHDPQAFTQGLVIHNGYFYESTGLYNQSSLRKVEIDTGIVRQQIALSPEYFAEGLTIWEDRLVQLTWRENVGFVYALADFSHIDQFDVLTEGWGLTHDGAHLIQSDGSASLYFLDPETYQVTDSITVTDQGAKVDQLNELEYIQGEIYANIWRTDTIVRINPETGIVLGWIDLTGLLPEESRSSTTDVLNGIAYDPEANRLFVTGKNWPNVFEIRLVPIP